MTPSTRRRLLAVVGSLVGAAGCNDASSTTDTAATGTTTAAPVPTGGAARAGRVTTVVDFEGAGPIGLATAQSGDLYLAMSLSGAIRRLPATALAATDRPGTATELVATLPADRGLVSALDVHDGTVYATLDSGDAATHGVWQIPLEDGDPRRLAAVAPTRRLGGVLVDRARERLYVTGLHENVVSTVGLADGTATPWLDHQLLDTDGRGPTGLAGTANAVYVTTHEPGRVVRARSRADGTAAAPTVVAADALRLSGASGLALGDERTYVAAASLNRVVTVDAEGRLRRLAEAGDGLNVPTDVALGPDGDALFVANFGFKPLVGLTGPRSLLRVTL